jgi:hypothetical protein
MRLTEFCNLPESIQLAKLYKDGAYIGKRKHEGQTVLLFQYHGFYAEIYYSSYRKEIDHIVLSEDVTILHPYFDQIHVAFFNKTDC